MYENNLPAINLADTPTQEPSKLWLWIGLVIAGYYLFKDNKGNKKKPVKFVDDAYEDIDEEEPSDAEYEDEPSMTPSDLHGLSGSLRTCDAWFQTTDKRGKSVNRCFIYKPSCNTKKCKIDTNVSRETNPAMQGIDNVYPFTSKNKLFGLHGYTATCKAWTKNRLGHKSCKSYAPTCKLPTDECRDVSAPLPYQEYTKQKRTAKDTEQETMAIAQMLADEANDDLKRNKELLREVIGSGGIAPHKSGFMSEEYKYLPPKYKREKGVPMDALAQELNMTENELADKIYMAEAQFRMLKEMRGGSTTVKFKSDDFLDEAVQRMNTGRGFMGLGEIVYHGTHNKFNKFSLDVPIVNPNANEGLGIFFSKSPVHAMKYAYPDGDVIEADIELKKPYIVEDYQDLYKRFPIYTRFKDDPRYGEHIGKKIKTELQRQGYDGVIFKHDPLGPGQSKMSGSWWIAFNPDTIKDMRIKNMKNMTVDDMENYFNSLQKRQKKTVKNPTKMITAKAVQMTLFGRLPMPMMGKYYHG